jgi:hypothetical protein
MSVASGTAIIPDSPNQIIPMEEFSSRVEPARPHYGAERRANQGKTDSNSLITGSFIGL